GRARRDCPAVIGGGGFAAGWAVPGSWGAGGPQQRVHVPSPGRTPADTPGYGPGGDGTGGKGAGLVGAALADVLLANTALLADTVPTCTESASTGSASTGSAGVDSAGAAAAAVKVRFSIPGTSFVAASVDRWSQMSLLRP